MLPSVTSSTIVILMTFVSQFISLKISKMQLLEKRNLIDVRNAANINSSAIVATASLVARSLYILATDNKTINSSALSAIHVNASLVEELIGCLLSCNPGLSCALVKQYISPSTSTTCPSHYSGVILGEPSSVPYLGYVDDISRFIWNFLADRTSVLRENGSTSCSKDCSNKLEVCIKAEIDGKGICVISTTR